MISARLDCTEASYCNKQGGWSLLGFSHAYHRCARLSKWLQILDVDILSVTMEVLLSRFNTNTCSWVPNNRTWITLNVKADAILFWPNNVKDITFWWWWWMKGARCFIAVSLGQLEKMKDIQSLQSNPLPGHCHCHNTLFGNLGLLHWPLLTVIFNDSMLHPLLKLLQWRFCKLLLAYCQWAPFALFALLEPQIVIT